jgi:cytochrome bd-type quinol oxidase subunit 2
MPSLRNGLAKVLCYSGRKNESGCIQKTWMVVTLIYLYGDVLRIYTGEAKALADKNLNQFVWLGLAVLMLMPILMVFLTLVLPQSASRWANIIVAAFFFLFNLVGLPTYPSLYDKFLLAVSMGFNVVTIWYAWNWS